MNAHPSPTAAAATASHGIAGKLAALGLSLPEPVKPIGNYIPAKRIGDLVFVSGQIPMKAGQPIALGTVPIPVSIDQARACAEQCVLNALTALLTVISDLEKVVSVVRIGVFVASGPEFTDHPKVADGASELLGKLFGEAGRHVRAAVGSSGLPRGVPVEIEFTFHIRD